jgi:hypothetical protein
MGDSWIEKYGGERARPALGLSDWNLGYSDKIAKGLPKNVSAVTHIEEDHPLATVKRGPGWKSCGEEQRRRTVIHELSHVLVANMSRVFEDLADSCDESVAAVARKSHKRAEEVVCDNLARGLYEHLWPQDSVTEAPAIEDPVQTGDKEAERKIRCDGRDH